MEGCDGNYWDSARNSQRKCTFGGGFGSESSREARPSREPALATAECPQPSARELLLNNK